MITLLVISSFILLMAIISIMYIIGFFNAKVAGRVELVLFTISNLRPNQKNARKIFRHIRLLAKAIIHKRRLFANKIRMRRLLKEFKKTREQK